MRCDAPGDWLSLQGRTALVTGTSQGIGAAIARLFLRQGARVVAHHKDGTALPIDIAQHPNVLSLTADVGDPAAIAAMFEDCACRGLEVDLLVNNAGIFPRVDPLELD